jgi:predicted nucleic acid-binding protein
MLEPTERSGTCRWCVVDATVWVSRFVSIDVNYAISEEWLRSYLVGGNRIVAPTLLLVEIAGAIARRTSDPRRAQRVVDLVTQERGIRWVAVTLELGRLATDLAIGLRLRGADAIYVALADRLGISLLTWDVEQLSRGKPRVDVQAPTTDALG